MKYFLLILISIIISCKVTYEPGKSLSEIQFDIYPCITKINNKFYLIYQLKSSHKSSSAPLLSFLESRVISGKAYYFFTVPISHIDFGKKVERDIAIDNFVSYAENDEIYWLNKDKTSVKLSICSNE